VIDLTAKAKGKITSVYDLFDTTVQVTETDDKGNKTITTYTSPLSSKSTEGIRQMLPGILDKCTTSKDVELQGRVNINTASKTVLATLPGLTPEQIDSIYTTRPTSLGSAADDIMQTPAWLITELQIPLATVKALEKYVTCYTQVYLPGSRLFRRRPHVCPHGGRGGHEPGHADHPPAARHQLVGKRLQHRLIRKDAGCGAVS